MGFIILALMVGLLLGWLIQHLRTQKLRLEFEVLKEKYNLQERYHLESSEKLEFKLKDISQQIFEEKSKRFREDSLKGMELVLNPFREK